MAEMLSVQETAEALGLSAKAVQRRIERGSIQSLRNDGRRWIPRGEIERLRQLENAESTGVSGAGQDRGSGDLSAVLERLETLAAENGRFRALQEVNDTERQELRRALFEQRAKVTELEAKLADAQVLERAGELVAAAAPRPRWWQRTRA